MPDNAVKFYNLNLEDRRDWVAAQSGMTREEVDVLSGIGGLSAEQADHMIENVIGVYGLPLGIARHFRVNGRDVLVPMVLEEPSVVASASFMAKLVQTGGGFFTTSSAPEMIGQMQILDLDDAPSARLKLLEHRSELLDAATAVDPVLSRLGGGARDLQVRLLEHPALGHYLVLHLVYDVRDAMGANAVNTALERLAPMVERISGGRVHLKILTNLAERRIARARATIKLEALAFDDYSAEQVRDGIIAAWAFADSDPYRAATHNKGIMNGVDAVVIATGNDWRAIEAGAHAYAARNGSYTSLSSWGKDRDGNLVGSLEMPMAVGPVGGATRVHPGARAALKLTGAQSASELAEIIVAVGLAQNLAALRALATEGIQRGHMSLHARQVAIAAGASTEQVERLAAQLVSEKVVRIDRAQEILKSW